MASRLTQLTAKVKQASEFVARSGGQYYKKQTEKNKKYVVNPPTIDKCKELSKQLFYTRLARFIFSTIFMSILVFLKIYWLFRLH
jgi:F-type H+-transporting ATPase subunit g